MFRHAVLLSTMMLAGAGCANKPAQAPAQNLGSDLANTGTAQQTGTSTSQTTAVQPAKPSATLVALADRISPNFRQGYLACITQGKFFEMSAGTCTSYQLPPWTCSIGGLSSHFLAVGTNANPSVVQFIQTVQNTMATDYTMAECGETKAGSILVALAPKADGTFTTVGLPVVGDSDAISP